MNETQLYIKHIHFCFHIHLMLFFIDIFHILVVPNSNGTGLFEALVLSNVREMISILITFGPLFFYLIIKRNDVAGS